MRKNRTDTVDENPADIIDAVATAMLEFRQEMEHFDGIGTRIARQTRLMMQIVFFALALSSLYLGYIIYNMSTNMSQMTRHLEDMYSNFGVMSENMHDITRSVSSMNQSISGMPHIAQSMIQIDEDVRAMNGSVFEINKSINAIDNDMLRINGNMQEMTGRLVNINHAVYSMSNDVNEMQAPANSGPMSGMWPR